MSCYWDSSALLALIFEEAATRRARALANRPTALPGYTSFFTQIEMESAYARRLSEGTLVVTGLPQVRLQAAQVDQELGLIWADSSLLEDARRLVLELGLRPGDALQLASARVAASQDESCAFASLDRKLNQAAQAIGLRLAL